MSARCILLAGLGFGDETKGSTAEYLVIKYGAKLVVRTNGGPQTAHNVVLSDGRHHTFSQFGSGTLAGARTLLTRHVLFNPIALAAEARHLESIGVQKPLSLIDIERGALITTPFHIAANRIREMSRGDRRHGSCGMGIGETAHDALLHPDAALRAEDLLDPYVLREKLVAVRERMLRSTEALRASAASSPAFDREREILEDADSVTNCMERYGLTIPQLRIQPDDHVLRQALEAGGTVVFEGAQGVLLDEDYGFHPHTTWSHTTFRNALEAIRATGVADVRLLRLGILRAYATRHGAGPFVTEDERFKPCSDHDHNTFGEWQHGFRSGALDLVSARYAIDAVGGIDGLVVSCLDRLPYARGGPSVCTSYVSDAPVDAALFSMEADRIVGIRFQDQVDLERQERITKALGTMRPQYETIVDGVWRPFRFGDFVAESYAAEVGRRLGVPVSITSSGPTARDKLPMIL